MASLLQDLFSYDWWFGGNDAYAPVYDPDQDKIPGDMMRPDDRGEAPDAPDKPRSRSGGVSRVRGKEVASPSNASGAYKPGPREWFEAADDKRKWSDDDFFAALKQDTTVPQGGEFDYRQMRSVQDPAMAKLLNQNPILQAMWQRATGLTEGSDTARPLGGPFTVLGVNRLQYDGKGDARGVIQFATDRDPSYEVRKPFRGPFDSRSGRLAEAIRKTWVHEPLHFVPYTVQRRYPEFVDRMNEVYGSDVWRSDDTHPLIKLMQLAMFDRPGRTEQEHSVLDVLNEYGMRALEDDFARRNGVVASDAVAR